MAVDLQNFRLVFIANADGVTAVGDYSENFIRAVRPYFRDVVEIRTGGPGNDTIAGLREVRRQAKAAIASAAGGRVLVHAELSAGALAPFWSVTGLGQVPVTATVHDPPQGVWWPARTAFMARHRLLMHGFHYPLRPVSRKIEGRVNAQRTLFALTETGRRSIETTFPRVNAVYVPHLVAERPAIRPASERPRAVGFFGMVYRGKGFDQIERIRALLPPDILIRIAGRGTESLPKAPGIDIVGSVDGSGEDEFFDSIRAVAVPYGRRHFYAETFPASGVVAHAMAYRTPVVCTAYGSLAELDDSQGVVVVRPAQPGHGDIATPMAEQLAAVVNDDARVVHLASGVEKVREERLAPRIAEQFAETWRLVLSQRDDRV